MQIQSIPAYFLRPLLLLCMLAAGGAAGLSNAHAQVVEPLRNVVQLSAAGQLEVEQDWLQVNLMATRDGVDAAAVQNHLQQVVDAAMHHLKAQAQGQQLQVRSGGFGVYPRHGNDGKIKGWQGRAEIVVEGNDFARISQAAAQTSGMVVAGMGFGLSKEKRQKIQDQAQVQAIEQFKSRAMLIAQQLGFSGYTLREVNVSSQEGFFAPRMQRTNAGLMAASAKMEMADPLPVEAGKEQVSVTVSGSVQLQ